MNQADLRIAFISELQDLQITEHVVNKREDSMIAQIAVLVSFAKEAQAYALHRACDLFWLRIDDTTIWYRLTRRSFLCIASKYEDRCIAKSHHQRLESQAELRNIFNLPGMLCRISFLISDIFQL